MVKSFKVLILQGYSIQTSFRQVWDGTGSLVWPDHLAYLFQNELSTSIIYQIALCVLRVKR